MGDPAAAESYLREAVAAAPDDWETHFGLGEALRARDPQAAKAEYSAALDALTGNLDCLINLCVCDLAGGNAIEAEARARRALRSPKEVQGGVGQSGRGAVDAGSRERSP